VQPNGAAGDRQPQAEAIGAMGPLSLILAAPLKKPDNAETQIFLFSLGQTF
jgi:outer membrane protein assembly factor BamA